MKTLALLLCLYASNAFGMMLDIDGKPIEDAEPLLGYSLLEVTMHCQAKGYFIYDSTIYMCVKIQENVDKQALRDYNRKDMALQAKKRKEQLEWYREWIKTDEGKTWKKEYDEKLKAKEAEDHK